MIIAVNRLFINDLLVVHADLGSDVFDLILGKCRKVSSESCISALRTSDYVVLVLIDF